MTPHEREPKVGRILVFQVTASKLEGEGTALVTPHEREPKVGRILVFQVTASKLEGEGERGRLW